MTGTPDNIDRLCDEIGKAVDSEPTDDAISALMLTLSYVISTNSDTIEDATTAAGNIGPHLVSMIRDRWQIITEERARG